MVEQIAGLEEEQACLGELCRLLTQVPEQLRLGSELCAVEARFHFPDRRLQPCHLLADAGLGHVVDLVVQLLAAEEGQLDRAELRPEEHTSELQSLMRISYAVFCLKKKK